MRLCDFLLGAAADVPNDPAIEFRGKSFNYAELVEESKQIGAGLLDLGIGPRASVAVMLPNLPEFVAAHYGILMSGNIFVPFNVLLQAPEINYLVTDSNVRAIITYETFLHHVEAGIKGLDDPPKIFVVGKDTGGHGSFGDLHHDHSAYTLPVPIDLTDPIMTIYTSGTTGKPKGAQLSNVNVVANMIMVEEVFEPEPGDKNLCVLPLFHVFALNAVLNSSIKLRQTVVLHPMFEVEAAVKSLAEDDITMFAGVPTMYFYILKHLSVHPTKFPKLRVCLTGGAAMPVDVLHQFEKATGCTVYEGYGLTETTVSVCCNRPGDRRIGSIGKPFKKVQMKIIDEQGKEVADGETGEVLIKAPNVMMGYLNKPEATAEAIQDGWFHSGDIGKRDEDGFFYIVDRIKDMIIKGGYNIYPREIEEVIFQLPEIAEAAVVGVFDEAKGEQIRAVVAFKPGKTLAIEVIQKQVAANLAKYKWPLDYIVLDELPKGPTGKILKREIRKNWEQWNRDRVPAREAS
jgi:long-chain acyl-CoA synthetase